MSSRTVLAGRSRLRRITAMLALLGLVFASTIASVSHSLATPMMATTLVSGERHHSGQNTDDQHENRAGHQHYHGEQDLADGPVDSDKGPCQEGCFLCKDCSLCSLASLNAAPAARDLHGQSYQLASLQPLTDITLPALAEPPRV